MQHEFNYPESSINTIDGNGIALSNPRKGVTVVIHQLDGFAPHGAEIYDKSGEEYADIGLTFDVETKQLVDYDGCFNLPKEIRRAVESLGWKCNEFLDGE